MDTLEFKRWFQLFYKQADYKTRKEIDREIHQILARKDSEKRLYNAFFKAIKEGNKYAVEKILSSDERVDINKQDNSLGNTALIYAIIYSNLKLVKLLLDHGANPLLKNYKGKDSLDAAKLVKESTELTKLILEYVK